MYVLFILINLSAFYERQTIKSIDLINVAIDKLKEKNVIDHFALKDTIYVEVEDSVKIKKHFCYINNTVTPINYYHNYNERLNKNLIFSYCASDKKRLNFSYMNGALNEGYLIFENDKIVKSYYGERSVHRSLEPPAVPSVPTFK